MSFGLMIFVLFLTQHASVHQRRAILGFLAELDIQELPLFFFLLIKPLQGTSVTADVSRQCLLSSSESIKDEFDSISILKQFTVDGLKGLSWKKKFGFLHVIEEILAVFDEYHINPFLNLLMGCVVRVLESCTAALESSKCKEPSLTDSGFNVAAAYDIVDREIEIVVSLKLCLTSSVSMFIKNFFLCTLMPYLNLI